MPRANDESMYMRKPQYLLPEKDRQAITAARESQRNKETGAPSISPKSASRINPSSGANGQRRVVAQNYGRQAGNFYDKATRIGIQENTFNSSRGKPPKSHQSGMNTDLKSYRSSNCGGGGELDGLFHEQLNEPSELSGRLKSKRLAPLSNADQHSHVIPEDNENDHSASPEARMVDSKQQLRQFGSQAGNRVLSAGTAPAPGNANYAYAMKTDNRPTTAGNAP